MTSAKRIFIIDDESDLTDLLRYQLKREGFKVEARNDPFAALSAARDFGPDLIVLDVMMPDMDGFQLLRMFRSDNLLSEIPVVMLTARAGVEDRIKGLELGAHDYVTKPFSPRELVLLFKNLPRPTEKSPNGVELIEAGPFRLDTIRHQATAGGRSLNITATEFKLLCLLASTPALARLPVSISQMGYPVDLADATDLHEALTAASPIRIHGGHSLTRWSVRWRSFWRADNGLCRMQRVSTEVDIEHTLPDAVRLPRRSALRQRYTDYLAALRAHEQGHADLAVQAAREIEQALMAVPPHPDCDGLSAAANRRAPPPAAMVEHTLDSLGGFCL